MQGDQKDIRTAAPDNQPDVTLTYEQMMEELTKEINIPLIDEHDITIARLVEATGLSENGLRGIMKKKVASHEYEIVPKRNEHHEKIQTFVKCEIPR